MQWKDEYPVGIAWIGDQHKGVIDLFTVIDAAIENRESWSYIFFKLEQLREHARFHFAPEESLMRTRLSITCGTCRSAQAFPEPVADDHPEQAGNLEHHRQWQGESHPSSGRITLSHDMQRAVRWHEPDL
jgi:hypothetical protein